MVERLNRMLEAQLSIFVDDRQTDWDTYLPMLMMAYWTVVQESTRCSPARLFGRELKLPIDLVYGRPIEERPNGITPYAEDLLKTLEDIHDFARKRLELASDRMKSYYDSKCSQCQFKNGDAVWLHNPQRKKGISPKLSRSWQGPYVVTKCINDLIFQIQLGPKTKPKVVHHNRLWKYQGEHPPTWFQTFRCQSMQGDTYYSHGEEYATRSRLTGSKPEPPEQPLLEVPRVVQPHWLTQTISRRGWCNGGTTNRLHRTIIYNIAHAEKKNSVIMFRLCLVMFMSACLHSQSPETVCMPIKATLYVCQKSE